VTRRTRVLSFRPGAVFALVRWTANDFGTVHSRIDIMGAALPGQAYTAVPFVRPGGDLSLIDRLAQGPERAGADRRDRGGRCRSLRGQP
jgi:hypothetical protein